ncbi:DUF1127 domain-containing protein [Thalassobius sp. Cn5-15]|uniref:DUF1127 domain-containing protein n=1 Tax=Thalassobius sp. Cn5-15 TaxID=2917763 RepID=UPI001EF36F62|nr:DUF1127 domain-containing protein [Thalassobius sp. Cn5-15]MCG7492108.1 DUF1127 domain-containing protein [Thalassobius sp. Cn5-15]
MPDARTSTVYDVITYDLGQTAPLAAQLALSFAITLTHWHRRHHTRKALRALPDHILADVGLSRDAAYTEARRPFWRA